MAAQKPQRVVEFDGQEYEFPSDATDTEISAFLKAIPAANAKDIPKARTWTDVAVDALPAAGAVVGGVVGATGGPLTGVAGAGVGGMVGDALKQAANKLRGEAVPETVPAAIGEMAGEAAMGSATAAPFAAVGAAAPMVGAGLRVGGEAMATGADALRGLLSLGGGWKSKIAQLTIPPLVKAGGKGAAATGKAIERLAGTSAGQQALRAKLSRIPLEGRLAQIGAETVEAAPKIAADTAQALADDVGLIRESISMGMDPKVAIRIIANGSAEYADALKDAYVASVKTGGLPPPAAVMKIMKLPAFQKLAKP